MANEPASLTTSVARWLYGRVVTLPENRVCVVLDDDREHVISRDQAIALGTRLLEVGIGTTYADERAINAQIGDLVCAAKRRLVQP